MYTKTDTSKFAHFVQTQSMSTYEARITPMQTQIDELLRINPDTLTPAHLRMTTIMEDPMQPFANTTKKSMNFDEAIGMDSQLLQDLPDKDKRTLLLRWHYRLGHLPFCTLINLAKQGLIDQQLANINEPHSVLVANTGNKRNKVGTPKRTRNCANIVFTKPKDLGKLSQRIQ